MRLLRRYHLGDAPRAEEVVPLRLVTPPEPVRPRRVELPENRRSERPAPEASDPLDEIRAGWRAIRSTDPLPEPAAVLRFAEPQPETAAPLRLTEPLPRVELPEDVPEPAEVIPPPEEVRAVEEPALEPEAPAEESLPRAVRIWRDIVARSTEIPPNSPVLAMIDQLLYELSRDDELSDGTGPGSATIIARNQAA
jgi:hypothetical protein